MPFIRSPLIYSIIGYTVSLVYICKTKIKGSHFMTAFFLIHNYCPFSISQPQVHLHFLQFLSRLHLKLHIWVFHLQDIHLLPVYNSLYSITQIITKRPLPSLYLKAVHTHQLKLFNLQLFRIVSFSKSLHYAPCFLQTLHNFRIIYVPKSLQPLINTKLIYLKFSSLGTIIHP